MKPVILIYFLLVLSGTAFAYPKIDQIKTSVYWVLTACDAASIGS